MFYLFLAILSSACVSIFMRCSEKHIENEMWMFASNYFVCIIFSLLYKNSLSFSFYSTTFLLGVISGILYLVSFVFLKYNMKRNGMILASTFMKLGILIPTFMAIFIYKEIPSFYQLLGIILSIIAIITLHFEKEEEASNKNHFLLLLLLFLSGFTDSMANIFEKSGFASEKDLYLLLTFFTAFLLAFLLSLKTRKKPTYKDILFGFLIGIPNYFSARFLLMALNFVPAILVYPMYSVIVMVLINLCGITLFKEKLSMKKAGALFLILLAVCLLNL